MKKILIVEDNQDILEAIAEILELKGYDTEIANNGKRGLELAKTKLPDLIISDIKMPIMSGYQMLEALQANTSTALIPFIFLTANAQKKDILQGKNSKANRYLTKPFTMKDLLKNVTEILEKKEKAIKI